MERMILATLFILGANSSYASVGSHWSGAGEVYKADGTFVQNYSIDVLNSQTETGKVHSVSTMTFDDGSTETIEQDLELGSTTWSDSSNVGAGGGACYGKNVCTNYLRSADGVATSSTIVQLSHSVRLDVTYVIVSGSLLQVFKDKIHRVK